MAINTMGNVIIKYLIASDKSIDLSLLVSEQGTEWGIVTSTEKLEQINLKTIDTIFFLYWSDLVKESVLSSVRCVCFHMTDLPFGRGGSPLQNLIIRGFEATKLTALRMTPILDEGPIYMKSDLSLLGSAEEIYRRAAILAFKMMRVIIRDNPVAINQSGDVVQFFRRKPLDSILPGHFSSERQMYDFIRMLDAPGYPKAHLVGELANYTLNSASLLEDEFGEYVQVNIRVKHHE